MGNNVAPRFAPDSGRQLRVNPHANDRQNGNHGYETEWKFLPPIICNLLARAASNPAP